MKIDETLKSNLIADVENILEVTLTPNEDAALARCFEITIGHHYASQSKDTVSDEDIDAFYPVKSETKALSMEYIIRQEGKREGAKAMRDGKIKPSIETDKK